jgi:uncharacterized protein (TIGR03083 family)
MSTLRPLPPLDTAPLFPRLHAELLALLRELEPADWERPTVAAEWRVRDVAAHLLDGDLRTLAAHRDGHVLDTGSPPTSYADVVALIQRLNAGGVAFGARLSPRLLTELLEVTGRWMSAFVATLDPDAPALFAVAWAGDVESDNRFDTAREYTERWHHQMQIRAAVGTRARPEVLLAPEYLVPLLETSLRALPHAYRAHGAPEGTSVVLRVAGSEHRAGDPSSAPDSPFAWTLARERDVWRLYRGAAEPATAVVEAAPDALWRLLYNALPTDEAHRAFTTTGPPDLLAPLWRARSVMV